MVRTATEVPKFVAFDQCALEEIQAALGLGEPILPAKTQAWLLQMLFGDTSFVAMRASVATGIIISCVERRRPQSLYVEKVAVAPSARRQGIAKALIERAANAAAVLGCRSIWLTTDPANPACHAWVRLGFMPEPNAEIVNGWPTVRALKGIGLDRAVFRRTIP
jgi:GNAT superfamily N-acetyltransferase